MLEWWIHDAARAKASHGIANARRFCLPAARPPRNDCDVSQHEAQDGFALLFGKCQRCGCDDMAGESRQHVPNNDANR